MQCYVLTRFIVELLRLVQSDPNPPHLSTKGIEIIERYDKLHAMLWWVRFAVPRYTDVDYASNLDECKLTSSSFLLGGGAIS